MNTLLHKLAFANEPSYLVFLTFWKKDGGCFAKKRGSPQSKLLCLDKMHSQSHFALLLTRLSVLCECVCVWVCVRVCVSVCACVCVSTLVRGGSECEHACECECLMERECMCMGVCVRVSWIAWLCKSMTRVASGIRVFEFMLPSSPPIVSRT